MIKSLISLRKHTWLPLKWFVKRKNYERKLDVRLKDKILGRIEELKAEVIRLDRLGEEKINERNFESGKLSALKWVLYDSTKQKGN